MFIVRYENTITYQIDFFFIYVFIFNHIFRIHYYDVDVCVIDGVAHATSVERDNPFGVVDGADSRGEVFELQRTRSKVLEIFLKFFFSTDEWDET